MQRVYSLEFEFKDWDEANGDAEYPYYISGRTQLYVATVYYKMKDHAADAISVFSLKLKQFPLIQLCRDRLQGKRFIDLGKMVIGPYMAREEKEEVSNHIIEQIYKALNLPQDAAKDFLDARFSMKNGYMLVIGQAQYAKYVNTIERLFHNNKIWDKQGHQMKLFLDSEVNETHD